jgi:hypothetical protein
VVIDGDKFTISHAGRDEVDVIKLDPSKAPNAIDVTQPSGDVLLGIYEIDGDRLRIALAPPRKAPKEENRAAKFESAAGSGVVLVVLKRVEKAAENKLPDAARKALEEAKELELYSLDPTSREEKPKDAFHDWKVLGKTTLKKDDAKSAAAAVLQGVADSKGIAANCFDPRHGVRVTDADGTTYDFVICFQCLQVKVYAGGKELAGALTAESPQPKLDKLLKDAGVPLAPKPGADK